MDRSCRAYSVILVMVLELVASVIMAGCGGADDELPRESISGTVTLNGEPLKAGSIQFQPTGQGGGNAGSATITDGNYSIAKVEGLVPGKYLVLITSSPAQTARAGQHRYARRLRSDPTIQGDDPGEVQRQVPAFRSGD